MFAKALLEVLPPKLTVSLRAIRSRQRGERELRLLDILCDPARAALDVGANKGIYTYYCRRHASHVYAVEANPQVAKRLSASFGKGVSVLNLGLSDKPGSATIHVPIVSGREVDTRGSLERSVSEGAQVNSFEIECKTLDQLDLRDVGFMKIDVEGHELNVLQGATAFLKRERPVVLVEVEERHRPGATRGVFDLLQAAGYQGCFLDGKDVRPIEEFTVQEHQQLAHVKPVFGARTGKYVNNFIFFPGGDPTRLAKLRQRARSL